MTKICSICRKKKDAAEFWSINKAKGQLYPSCISCQKTAKWPAASYKRVHNFSPVEEYIIDKLAEKPTLSSALVDLYRRSPRRWHQVVVAATLTRKEAMSV